MILDAPRVLVCSVLVCAIAACASKPAERPSASRVSEPAAPRAVQPAPVRAVAAADPRESVVSREPWSFDGAPGRIFRTASYTFYTTETQPVIIDRLPGYMQAALDHYTSALGPLKRPAGRMDSFIMASRTQWQRLTLRMLGPAAVPVTFIERGGFTTGGRAFLFDIGAVDTFSIASHEGWHQFSQTTFRDRLPLFLEEGVAAFMEGHRWLGDDVVFLGWSNTERFDRLREAVARHALHSLEELFASSPGALMAKGQAGPLTYYAQCWAFVHFLREGERGAYADGFRNMIADAAEGRLSTFVAAQLKLPPGVLNRGASSGPSASQIVRAYISPDLPRLAREFEAFQRAIVRTGARDAVIEGRSPLSP